MGDLLRAIEALKGALAGVDGTVTLGLEASRGDDGQWSWRLATGPTPHAIRLDLGRGSAEAAPGHPGAGTAWDAGMETEALGQLELVFGAPGFDSGARATVFRELAADAGEEGLRLILGLLPQEQPAGDADLERVRHGLTRLLERGPSGWRDGGAILGRVVARHGLERVLELVASRWRFGG